ncbi:hypothetical protein [Argonema galeatum]|uniref:hypothetical protein n=1 Tax=Argonema galeatum TaxID=2942762 RepID=UPI002011A696|nr:hypothetical protein [Argonema galeatum]MCL1465753.1 hypothetical protein [Argonema galeatum A003/A1]
MHSESMKPNTNKSEKQVYRSPKLFVYGDIRELTMSTSTAGPTLDNPNGPAKSKA